MKNWTLALILLVLPTTALAQWVASPIETLDLGSCWLQKLSTTEDPVAPAAGYKFVSFGAGQAWSIYQDAYAGDTLQTWITEQLKTEFPKMESSRYSVGVHCYSSGYQMSIKIDRGSDQPICLNLRSKSGAIHDFELLSIRPDTEFGEGEFCLGIQKQVLGMTLQSGDAASVEAIRLEIHRSPELQGVIQSIDHTPGMPFAMIRLQPEWAYREVAAQTFMDQVRNENEVIREQARGFWTNPYGTITGESRTLIQGMTLGY